MIGREGDIVIQDVHTMIDAGRYPVKRIVGDVLKVEAEVFTTGEKHVCVDLLVKPPSSGAWLRVPMEQVSEDRYVGHYTLLELGSTMYTLEAWVDEYHTWLKGFARWLSSG